MINSPIRKPFHQRFASWSFFAIAVSGLLAACTTPRVIADYDRRAQFDGYRSYAWLPRAREDRHNLLAARFAREAIDAELSQRGFVLAEDPSTADFEVDFTIGARDRIDVRAYPEPYRGPWFWGRRYYGDAVDIRQYREGTLAIDIFDGRTHQPVWSGRATRELSRADLAGSEGPIREATAAVVAQFPPTPAGVR